MSRGFPLQDTGPGMNELFHDAAVEQEEERARRSGPWKCFFCGEVFADGVAAGRHFGEPEGCDCPVPGCVDPLRRDEKARLHAVQLANYEAGKAISERDTVQEANARLRSALVQIADVSFEADDALGACIRIAEKALNASSE